MPTRIDKRSSKGVKLLLFQSFHRNKSHRIESFEIIKNNFSIITFKQTSSYESCEY